MDHLDSVGTVRHVRRRVVKKVIWPQVKRQPFPRHGKAPEPRIPSLGWADPGELWRPIIRETVPPDPETQATIDWLRDEIDNPETDRLFLDMDRPGYTIVPSVVSEIDEWFRARILNADDPEAERQRIMDELDRQMTINMARYGGCP